MTGGSFTGNVALLVGSGDGTFNAPEFAPAESVHGDPYDLAFADFDGSGTLDVAASHPGSNTLSLLLNGVNAQPALSIGDATITEGNTGTRAAVFTVTLSAASSQPVTVPAAPPRGPIAAMTTEEAFQTALDADPDDHHATRVCRLVGGAGRRTRRGLPRAGVFGTSAVAIR